MFAKLTADYYGTPTPLQQLAGFTSPDARTILVAALRPGRDAAVEQAIRDSDLGVNPANDGKVLRCVFPELTEERRKEYIKLAGTRPRTVGSRCATSVALPSRPWRSSRRTARSARTTSPAPRSGSTAVTKTHTDQIDELLKHKEAELLEV